MNKRRERLSAKQREALTVSGDVFILTGATGHLGGEVLRQLCARGERVRALLLPGERLGKEFDGAENIECFDGDVRRPDTLSPLLLGLDAQKRTVVIHCAGIVTISDGNEAFVRDVNVGGTRNMIALCQTRENTRLVYVSSVHALPVRPLGETANEVTHFSPDDVTGLYAKTKAEASQCVLDAAREGLDALIVHPAGIIGPGGLDNSNMSAVVLRYLRGRLPAAVKGGFDFVDVRDVAGGLLSACDKGQKGECYILSGRYMTLKEFFDTLSAVSGRKKLRLYAPTKLVSLFAPLVERADKRKKRLPLFTRYSMYTLSQNAVYSHDKAARTLGYTVRSLRDTLRDTVEWSRAKRKGRAGS